MGVFFIGDIEDERPYCRQYGLAHEKMPLMAFFQRKRRRLLLSQRALATHSEKIATE
jgi:hypothetical protein